MRKLKLGYAPQARMYFTTSREVISLQDTDCTDVAVCVLTDRDGALLRKVVDTQFEVPIVLFSDDPEGLDDYTREAAFRVIDAKLYDERITNNEIENAALQYEERMLPTFFETLSDYKELNNIPFDCPGHQGGEYFRKHPAGRYLYDFYGETVFRSDICNADVALGDLLIHEGAAAEALKNAATVFNSDMTYFVMNGTSTSNMVTLAALVSAGDLVLFDRNNHKSIYDAALVKSGGLAVYLETARNPLGFIGGIDAHCFDESYLRAEIAKVDEEAAKRERPFRVAVIQLGTYDGTIYNARQVVDRIGKLCDYILFDSAWVGYEQFIPMMQHCSPLLLELGPDDPGIFVTQSVHKQQAGFSQASYIHKKDSHIEGQKRYVNNKVFNNSYRLHASTSPFYPIFASLDVNARMQDRKVGRKLWADCVKTG
ncbi:MAG: ornithine decarboxylase, partial [Clostridiales Family XIII bacterium]|nr:ornithine decarboxylase [Clostridiales Family XIII bacterium]